MTLMYEMHNFGQFGIFFEVEAVSIFSFLQKIAFEKSYSHQILIHAK